MLVGGLGHGVKNVLLRTLIHQRVPDAAPRPRLRRLQRRPQRRRARRAGAGGVLVGVLGARAALAIAGLVPLFIGLLALFIAGRREAPGSTTRRTAYVHS